MRETQSSICAWARETFGPAATLYGIATRANQEMAELLRAHAEGKPAAAVTEESADVAIILCRAGEVLGVSLNFDARPHSAMSDVTEIFARTNLDMGRLIARAHIRDAYAVEILRSIVWNLAATVRILGGDLQQAIDAKMAVNRAREWRLTGDGHGYHVRNKGVAA